VPVDRDGQPGIAKVAVEDGSTNVYADLGRPDADEMLVKAQLASWIGEVIRRTSDHLARAARRSLTA